MGYLYGKRTNRKNKTKRKKRVAKGLCSRCIQPIDFLRGKTLCTFHLDYSRNKKRLENPPKRIKIKICRVCPKPTAPDKLMYCEEHTKRHDAYTRQMISLKYGLSRKEYETLLKITKCQICNAEEKLHIDHDHITGKVRGRLCNTCNLRLGNQVENGWYQKAIAYLEAAV